MSPEQGVFDRSLRISALRYTFFFRLSERLDSLLSVYYRYNSFFPPTIKTSLFTYPEHAHSCPMYGASCSFSPIVSRFYFAPLYFIFIVDAMYTYR